MHFNSHNLLPCIFIPSNNFFHWLAFSWIVMDFVWCYSTFMVVRYISDLVFTPKTQHPCQNKSIWFSKNDPHSTNSFDFRQAWTYFYSLIAFMLTMISSALLLFICVIIGNNIGIVCVWVVTSSSLCKSLGHNLCQVIEDLNQPMPMAIYVWLAPSSLILKYSSCFSTSLS